MRIVVVIVVVALLSSVLTAGGVGWRGDGTGRYPDAKPPLTFSESEGVVWAAPMPDWSNASPVIAGDRIFVCAEPDRLIAVEKATGKVLWTKANPVSEASNAADRGEAPAPKTHGHNGFTSATPVSDGDRVFAVFGNGVVAAYDKDGERLWSRFVERPLHPWGHCSSPVLAGDLLLVHIETLVALDPADGTEKWRQSAEKWENQRRKQWGSPVATRIGETDVVVTTRGNVVRVADGEVLLAALAGTQFNSPLIDDGVAYFVDQKGARAVKLPEEVGGEPVVLWNSETAKERFYASPVLHDGLVYAVSQTGWFSAFDAETGEEQYREKLLLGRNAREKNAAYTSVTLGGDRLYLAGMNGSIVVVKPGRKYEVLARNTVENSLRSNPVFEDVTLFVRAPAKLYCFSGE